MPMPTPAPDEPKADFIARCMATPLMGEEYPDETQRVAVCEAQWKERPRSGGWPSITW